MPARKTAEKMHIEYHRDGSLWAKGRMIGGVPEGYWEWFRKDGTRMRSGYFEQGRQAGEWTTYDKKGRIVKVTAMKPAGKVSGEVREE
jgi:antitoxin component YwqK of YwqJK toxin-antitoxin module